ncbi:MAG TPA: type II toxin-antitoxin system RatA family toxin [Nitrococcus sp.]|nr:type II toxin-antitoxin system RatA family toxin [Nitrococcus sp.]
MTTVSRSALVPYSAEVMFRLVEDVDAYEQFLPWCKESRILHRNKDYVRAMIVVSKGGLEKSFTTQNRLHPSKMIDIRLVEGPFRRLNGFWRFQSLPGNGCKVALDLEFEFANRLIGMAFGRVFHQVANTLVDSFVRRADELYGNADAAN